jgi:hypothetical protein
VTWPSFIRIELICDLRSGSSVAAVWFAADEGTLTGVEGFWFAMMAAFETEAGLRSDGTA